MTGEYCWRKEGNQSIGGQIRPIHTLTVRGTVDTHEPSDSRHYTCTHYARWEPDTGVPFRKNESEEKKDIRPYNRTTNFDIVGRS